GGDLVIKRFFDRPDLVDDMARLGFELARRRRGDKLPSRTHKQFGLQLFTKRPHLNADRGSREMDSLCRAGHCRGVENGEKDLELARIHRLGFVNITFKSLGLTQGLNRLRLPDQKRLSIGGWL